MSDSSILEEAQRRLMANRKADRAKNPASYQRIGEGGVLQSVLEDIARRAMDKAGDRSAEIERYNREELERKRRSLAADREDWAYHGSGIPRKHLKQLLAGSVDHGTGPCEALRRSLSGGRILVGLLGQTGTGKTTAAVWALLSRQIELDEESAREDHGRPRPKAGKFITAVQWSRVPRWEQSAHEINTVGLLVLDDLGREPQDKRLDTEELLMQRYDNDLPTIFTSNFSAAELEEEYDARIVSRVMEVGEIFELETVLRPGG